MYDQEAIEMINADQLATPTDRVLLAARFGRARPSSSSLTAPRARTNRDLDATVLTRRPAHDTAAWRRFATTALVTSLVSVASAIAVLL